MKIKIVMLMLGIMAGCSALPFANPVKMDRIAKEMSTVASKDYVNKAQTRLEEEGYTTVLHVFSCPGGRITGVYVKHTNLGMDANHNEAVTMQQIVKEGCPLVGERVKWMPTYSAFGPPTGEPQSMEIGK